jgi:hypothetical protein
MLRRLALVGIFRLTGKGRAAGTPLVGIEYGF